MKNNTCIDLDFFIPSQRGAWLLIIQDRRWNQILMLMKKKKQNWQEEEKDNCDDDVVDEKDEIDDGEK